MRATLAMGRPPRRSAGHPGLIEGAHVNRLPSRLLLLASCIALVCGRLSALAGVWEPSPGQIQVPIWPGAIPTPPPVPRTEDIFSKTDWVVAGKPILFVVNGSQPTMTVHSPKENNTGVAVVVF